MHPLINSLLLDPFAETTLIKGETPAAPSPASHLTHTASTFKAHNFATGFIAGVAVPLVVNPLDKVTTNMMLAAKTAAQLSLKEALKINPYAGLPIAMLANIVKFGTLLGVKPIVEERLKEAIPENPLLSSIAASALAGTAEAFTTAPLAFLKTGLYRGKSVREILGDLSRTANATKTVFAGTSAAVARNASFAAICFPLIPVVEAFISAESSPLKEAGASTKSLLAGAVAGGVATIAANPFTVLSTRCRGGSAPGESMLTQAKKIIAEEGAKTLMRGAQYAVPRMVVVTALTSCIDQQMKKALGTTPTKEQVTSVDLVKSTSSE